MLLLTAAASTKALVGLVTAITVLGGIVAWATFEKPKETKK